MKHIELTLKAEYLSNWDIWHGIRELIQNSRDAEIQNNAKMEIDFQSKYVKGHKQGCLTITNTGVILPLESLLIGHTTKADDKSLIGKYGEGLKFSMLALLRHNLIIKIKNGSDTWIPKIVKSSIFDANVLSFEIKKGNKFENVVKFEITGLTSEVWKEIKDKVLFLNSTSPESLKTYTGEILLDKAYAGKIFVKGMFVSDVDNQFGFNLFEADIDRDRRMINDQAYTLNRVMCETMNTEIGRQHIGDHFYHSLKEGTIQYHYWLNEEANTFITEKFHKDFGENVIAVEHDAEASELEHLGSKGAKVNRIIRSIVEKKQGSAAENISKLRTSAKKTFSKEELSEVELENFNKSYALVNKAYLNSGEVKDLSVEIVEFSSDLLLGTYHSSDGKIRIAKKLLVQPADLIVTLVHEAAHKYGSSGEQMHKAEERLMTFVIHELLKK